MITHADKTQNNKSQFVSNDKSQMQIAGETTFQFVDNRPEAIVQRKLQKMANNSSGQQQLPIQRALIETESDQSYDKDGVHNSQGQTNPPNIVNTLNNNYSNVISDSSGSDYTNAHMMAATFGGTNAADNIAAWTEAMEEGWTEAENKIRGQDPGNMLSPRSREKGTVTTSVNMPEKFSGNTFGETIFETASPAICDPANWNVIVNAAIPGPTENELLYDDTLKSIFSARVNNDINNALLKMPDNARIEYQSSSPDTKRKFKIAFQDKGKIADPEITEDENLAASFISGLNVLPARNGRRLRTDL